MAHTENDRAHDDPAIKHETTDADLGGIERLVAFMAVFFVIVFVLIWFIYGQLLKREVRLDTPPPPIAQRQGDRLPPTPRLQTTPSADLAQFRATEEATLGAYAWTDKAAGLAQVPIGRAIDLVAEHGLPPRPPMPAPPTSAPGAGATAAPGGSASAAPAAPKP
jgi:hypothetical protein